MFFIFIGFSYSWLGFGHRIIALVAQRQLSQQQVEWLSELLEIWPEEETDFIGASTWQDRLKLATSKVMLMSTWHYVDTPFISQDFNGQLPPNSYNITEAINDIYSSLLNKTTTSPWALAFGIRSLIHFVGDAHCPPHAATYISSRYPRGDAGGNNYKLRDGVQNTNLHKLWDSGCNEYKRSPTRDKLHLIVDKLIENFNDTEKSKITDPITWTEEAHQIMKEFGYTLKPKSGPSRNYNQQCARISENQFVLAGLRLSKMLQNFFEVRKELPDIHSIPKLKYRMHTKSNIPPWVFVFVLLCIIVLAIQMKKMKVNPKNKKC